MVQRMARSGLAVAGVMIVVGMSLSASQSYAQQFEGDGFKGLLKGLGVTDKTDEEPIDIHERGPLVIPPSRELPPPQASSAARAEAWPNDPDAAKRATDKAGQIPPDQIRRRYDHPQLSPKEMMEGRLPGSGRQSAPYDAPGMRAGEHRVVISPNELKSGKVDLPENRPWNGKEPTRTRLSDPPEGYRMPAASAPFGPPPKTGAAARPSFWQRINPFHHSDTTATASQ
jgi:hypothetical protein